MTPTTICRAWRPAATGLALAALFVLSACGSRPPVPDWQINAQGAAQRATEAYLAGNERVQAAEWSRARSEVARTGRPELLARLELMRCAAQVASLALQPPRCERFEALREDAALAERVYADYLVGRLAGLDASQLPAAHQQALAAGEDPGAALAALQDPLARLVAAGALLQAGRAGPAVLQQASETASAQGWRRPLLAWLLVRLERAEQAGATQEADRLRRQVAVVEEQEAPAR